MGLVNQISLGRYDSYLSKLLQCKERSVAPSVATEILPVIDVEKVNPEGRLLQGVRLGLAGFEVAAVAAQFSIIILTNPAGSNQLLVVEHAYLTTFPGGAHIAVHNAVTGALPNTNRAGVRDTRIAGAAPAFNLGVTAQLFGGALAVVPGIFNFFLTFNTAGNIDLPLNLVLGPGSGVMLQSQVVNNALLGGFTWYERALEDSELKLGS